MTSLLARGAFIAVALLAGPALSEESQDELPKVLSSEGWFIAPGSLSFRAPENGLYSPWIATWERIDVGDKSLYIKVLVNCENFTVVPFLTVSPDHGVVPIRGAKPQGMSVEPDSPQDRMARSACSTFGFFS